jgi:hypothetical protein
MESIIRSIGRIPRQRNTIYEKVSQERYSTTFMSRSVVPGDVRARAVSHG